MPTIVTTNQDGLLELQSKVWGIPLKVLKSWLKPAKTPAEFLKRMLVPLEKPKRWCQNVEQETEFRSYKHPDDEFKDDWEITTQVCLVGAAEYVQDGTPAFCVRQAYKILAGVIQEEYRRTEKYGYIDDTDHEGMLKQTGGSYRSRTYHSFRSRSFQDCLAFSTAEATLLFADAAVCG